MPIYEFDGKKPLISPLAFVHPEAVIIGEASIGADCFIAPGTVIRADFGPVRIGRGSAIQDNAVIHVSPGDQVVIGDDVVVAHNVSLHDVTLHDRCVIGMGAVLLQRVICGEDAFIAAGSLVRQGMTVPSGKMAAGNPARIIKDITPEMKTYMADGIKQYKALVRLYQSSMKRI